MAKPREDRLKIREEVAALKRQRTLDAATDLFYDKGYTNTTLDDVAEVLGVTKPFIYANFGSKSALLTEICSLGVHGALEQIEFVLAQDLPPAEALRLFVPRYVTAILRRQKSIAINIREEKNLEPADAERLAELRQRFMSRVESLLAAGKEAGDIQVSDPRVSAFAIVGAVSWATFWFNPAGTLSVAQIADRMTPVILNLVRDGRSAADAA